MEVTVQEAKTHLSRLLRRVEAGEEVIIRRGQHPVAVLAKAVPTNAEHNIWGSLQGKMAPDFDELPDDFSAYTP